MNTIKMIPVERLKHHPENPRKDLGDLTELAESIKKNGVMQNLTVVCEKPGEAADGKYLVVIGNRRMEAAKSAGLKELPCVISDMDHKNQIATMLMENMQRQDLTAYEQAQGFQMMMDLGFTEKQIGEKTGFSERTVKDRIKLTKFNQKNFGQAVARGATLSDMLEISKLKSKKDQNEALAEAGTNNFRQKLKHLLGEQTYREGCEKLGKAAEEMGIRKLPEGENVYGSGKYTWLKCDADAGQSEDRIRKEIRRLIRENPEEELYFKFNKNWNDNQASLSIIKKNRKTEEKDLTEEELREKEKERQRKRRLQEVRRRWAEAYQLRTDFVRNYTVGVNGHGMTNIGKLILKYALSQQNYWNKKLPENQHWKEKYIRETLEIKQEEYEDKKSLLEQAEARGIPQIRLMLAWMMGGGVFDADSPEYGRYHYADGDFTMNNSGMITERYEFLKEIGYEMSDMEIQLMDGTHECYRKEEKASEK